MQFPCHIAFSVSRLSWTLCLLLFNTIQGQVITRGPYLQMQTDSGIVVMWRTDLPCASSVGISNTPGFTNRIFQDTTQVLDHKIKITGLNPATKYFYKTGNASHWFSVGDSLQYFKTAPTRGSNSAVKFWFTWSK